MVTHLRGELAVVAVGATLLIMGVFATGEMGRALRGGGMVFGAIGLVLVAVGLIRSRWTRLPARRGGGASR